MSVGLSLAPQRFARLLDNQSHLGQESFLGVLAKKNAFEFKSLRFTISARTSTSLGIGRIACPNHTTD